MYPFTDRRFEVRGKVVMITGAGSGIGAALAAVLHRRGASVALLDVNDTAINDAAETFGERALAISADVRDRDTMTRAVDTITDHYGRLDVVVANAGIAPDPATLRTIDPDEFDRVIDVNVTGVFNTIRPALAPLIAHQGHAVIVSSVNAFVPGPGLASYAASKAAVEQLGRALRIELAEAGASAGVAYFGFVRTPFMQPIDEDPLGRTLDGMLGWPLNRRITAEHAATVIADGIARRAAHTVAPSAWRPYALLRGTVNPLIDHHAAASPKMHGLIHTIEERLTRKDLHA